MKNDKLDREEIISQSINDTVEIIENAENQPAIPDGAKTTADFNVQLHRMGRIWDTIGILLILLVPVVACIYHGVMPDWSVFANAGVWTLLIINLGSAISEPVIYAPILGTNGEYLAFVTGNLSNLKIPCVVRAHEIVDDAKIGTEEHELVSTIAVAVSSLVTVLVIAVIVLALILSDAAASASGGMGLAQIIEANPFLTPSFGCVVYALFGSLGGKYMVKNPKMAIIPGLILVAISIVLALLGGSLGSLSLMVGIVLCFAFAALSFLREKKKAKVKEEERRLAAIAAGMSYNEVCKIEYFQKKEAEEIALKAKADKKAKNK